MAEMNPTQIFQIMRAWQKFTENHPKFPKFIRAVAAEGVREGTVMELTITTPEGKHQPQGSAVRFGTAGAASGDDALGQLPLKAHCKVTWANLHDGNRFAQAAIYYSAVKS